MDQSSISGQGPRLVAGQRRPQDFATDTSALSELTRPTQRERGLVIEGGEHPMRTPEDVTKGLGLDHSAERSLTQKLQSWSAESNPLVFRKGLMEALRKFAPADYGLRNEIARRTMAFWKATSGGRFSRSPGREGQRITIQKSALGPEDWGFWYGEELEKAGTGTGTTKGPHKYIRKYVKNGRTIYVYDDPEHKEPAAPTGRKRKRAEPKEIIGDWGEKHRYDEEEAIQHMERIGDSLQDAQEIGVQDQTGFSYSDMNNWEHARGNPERMKAILAKYKRQIGPEEHELLGLMDYLRAQHGPVEIKLDIHPRFGSLQIKAAGRISKANWSAYMAANGKLKEATGMWFDRASEAWVVKKDRIPDLAPVWAQYQADLKKLGIEVPNLPGQKERQKVVEEAKAKATPQRPERIDPVSGQSVAATTDEVIDRLRREKWGGIPETIAVVKDDEGFYRFYSPFSREFNNIFSNKSGVLTKITEFRKESEHDGDRRSNAVYRRTLDLALVEEAIDKIKAMMPGWKIVTEGVKDAQVEAEQKEANLRKPIPAVAKHLAPEFKLFPYQNAAVNFLIEKDGKALIGDEMGLGKTLQALAYVAATGKKVLVVVPKVVRRTWIQESEKFFPEYFGGKGVELVPADIKKKGMPDLSGMRIAAVNYESLEKFLPAIRAAGFDTIVVDESHRMKSPKAKITRTISSLRDTFPHRILLSGTAIKNKREELLTQSEFIQPGLFTKQELKGTIGGVWNKLNQSIYMARQKLDVLPDLPEKSTQITKNELAGMPSFPGDIGEMSRARANAAMAKTKLTVPFVKEILESSDSSVLVFTESVDAAKKMAAELGDVAILHYGQQSDDKREASKAEFQREGTTKRVFVSTRQSLAVGATLTAADKVVFNDIPWTAADLRQAEDRVHRVGQKNHVNVYWMTAERPASETEEEEYHPNPDEEMYWEEVGLSAKKQLDQEWDVRATEIVLKKYELGRKQLEGKQITEAERDWMTTAVNLEDIRRAIRGEPLVEGSDKLVDPPKVPKPETPKPETPKPETPKAVDPRLVRMAQSYYDSARYAKEEGDVVGAGNYREVAQLFEAGNETEARDVLRREVNRQKKIKADEEAKAKPKNTVQRAVAAGKAGWDTMSAAPDGVTYQRRDRDQKIVLQDLGGQIVMSVSSGKGKHLSSATFKDWEAARAGALEHMLANPKPDTGSKTPVVPKTPRQPESTIQKIKRERAEAEAAKPKPSTSTQTQLDLFGNPVSKALEPDAWDYALDGLRPMLMVQSRPGLLELSWVEQVEDSIHEGRPTRTPPGWPSEDGLEKGAGHKYLKRVPTGKQRPKYRYIYRDTKAGKLTSSDDVQVGSKFKVEHAGHVGHFEVLAHDQKKGLVTVKHDESGRTAHIKEADLHRMITAHHAKRTQAALATKEGRELAPALPRATMEDLGKGGFDNIEGFAQTAQELHELAAGLAKGRAYAVIKQPGGFVLASGPTGTSGKKKAPATPPAAQRKAQLLMRDSEGSGIKSVDVEFVVMEAKDLIASHNPTTFGERSDYPTGVQERRYHDIPEEQQKIDRIARTMEPALVINNNPDAINGTPIVTEDGVVLGGNGRSMGMQRAFARYPDNAKKMADYLAQHAQAFGMTPAYVAQFKEPVLVRRMKTGSDTDTLRALGRRMNESLTQGLDPRSAEVALGKNYVTQDVMDSLAHNMHPDESLADFLVSTRSAPFVSALENSGIIDKFNRAEFIAKKEDGGLLNEDGRLRVERVLAARLIPDAGLLSRMNQSVRQNLAKAVPFFSAMEGTQREQKAAWAALGTKEKKEDYLRGILEAKGKALVIDGSKYKADGETYDSLDAARDGIVGNWDMRESLKLAVKADQDMRRAGLIRRGKEDQGRSEWVRQEAGLDLGGINLQADVQKDPVALALIEVIQEHNGSNKLPLGFKQAAIEADRQLREGYGAQTALVGRTHVTPAEALGAAFKLKGTRGAVAEEKQGGLFASLTEREMDSLVKAKYLKREGTPGNYTYTYRHPQGHTYQVRQQLLQPGSRGQYKKTRDKQGRTVYTGGTTPPGEGWEAIAESKEGGMRRPVSGGKVREFEFWYPEGKGKQTGLFGEDSAQLVAPEKPAREAPTPKQPARSIADDKPVQTDLFGSNQLGLFKSGDGEGGAELGRYLMHAITWEVRRLVRAAMTGAELNGPALLKRTKAFVKEQALADRRFAVALGAHPVSDQTLRGLIQAVAESNAAHLAKSLAKAELDRDFAKARRN